MTDLEQHLRSLLSDANDRADRAERNSVQLGHKIGELNDRLKQADQVRLDFTAHAVKAWREEAENERKMREQAEQQLEVMEVKLKQAKTQFSVALGKIGALESALDLAEQDRNALITHLVKLVPVVQAVRQFVERHPYGNTVDLRDALDVLEHHGGLASDLKPPEPEG